MKFGWLAAYIATLLVEVPIYVLGTRRALGFGRSLLLAVCLNTLTHPLAWLATAASVSWWRFALVESAVWLIESGLLWRVVRWAKPERDVSLQEACALSLAANALSAGLGLLWQ